MSTADYVAGYASRTFEKVENLYETAYLAYHPSLEAQERAIAAYVQALGRITADRTREAKTVQRREQVRAQQARADKEREFSVVVDKILGPNPAMQVA